MRQTTPNKAEIFLFSKHKVLKWSKIVTYRRLARLIVKDYYLFNETTTTTDDFEKYKTAAMCIQETHMKGYGVIIYNQVIETTTYYITRDTKPNLLMGLE